MDQVELKRLKRFLDEQVRLYNRPEFIENDPISVPHRFSKKQDIEIAAFFAAIFSWGNRKTIIAKSLDLLQRMDYSPHDFMLNFKERDLNNFKSFVHRTFNFTDLHYFLYFLKDHYLLYNTLEAAFRHLDTQGEFEMKDILTEFHDYFFQSGLAERKTRKHLASPEKKSACKRINMFLRWMVRKDNAGVDFGIWNSIRSADLICPLDVHSGRVARKLGLLNRKQDDWTAAVELTQNLGLMNPKDPVIYDYALFGIGVNGKF